MAYIKLSKKAFFHNLKQIETVAPLSKIAVVLKDNAYGHGLLEMAQLAKEYGVKNAVVRTGLEAEIIKDCFDLILILSDIPKAPNSNFHITINSLEDINKIPKSANVHLKVDTGMHRNGIDEKDLAVAISRIKEQDLKLTGIFSHSRSSDELSTEAFWQLKNFKRIKLEVEKIVKDLNLPTPKFHIGNSATLFRFKESGLFDMARVGIANYGYSENHETIGSFDLKPVLSLWAEKISSRVLKHNTQVGYGGAYEAKEDMTVSTYDIGYSDGFFRLNESHNYQTPNGSKVLGRVSMDSMSINSDENEICLFDDAKKISDIFYTIAYEIVVKLPNYIKRVVYE